jgi:hypothetical protein
MKSYLQQIIHSATFPAAFLLPNTETLFEAIVLSFSCSLYICRLEAMHFLWNLWPQLNTIKVFTSPYWLVLSDV